MTIKEILFEKLKKGGYKNTKALSNDIDFDTCLQLLEKDNEAVFKAIYGNKIIAHGKRQYKEFMFHLSQAESDMRTGYIKMTVHYLLTQIKIGSIALTKSA